MSDTGPDRRPLSARLRESESLELRDRKPGFWGWSDGYDPVGDQLMDEIKPFIVSTVILLLLSVAFSWWSHRQSGLKSTIPPTKVGVPGE